MLTTYDEYKNKYSNSELTSETFETYNEILHLYFYNEIVYSKNQLLKRYDIQNIKNALLHQINYFEQFGIYDDGIVSQSAAGVSETINNNKSKGQLNISSILKKCMRTLQIKGKF